jgi:hypothetical protein
MTGKSGMWQAFPVWLSQTADVFWPQRTIFAGDSHDNYGLAECGKVTCGIGIIGSNWVGFDAIVKMKVHWMQVHTGM